MLPMTLFLLFRMEDDGAATRVRARFWPERGIEPRGWLIDVLDRGPGRRHTGTIGPFGGVVRKSLEKVMTPCTSATEMLKVRARIGM